MKDLSLSAFSEVLASKAAVPGGGGASALAGCLAAALGEMVVNLTSGKKKFAEYEDQLSDILSQLEKLRNDLLDNINDDAEAFQPLSQAYSLPKDDPSRDEVMEKCLKMAASAPLNILKNCCKVVDLLQQLHPISSKLAISDVATAAVIAQSGIKGGAINVRVNTKLMQDKQYSLKINEEVDCLCDSYLPKTQQIFDQIYKEMI